MHRRSETCKLRVGCKNSTNQTTGSVSQKLTTGPRVRRPEDLPSSFLGACWKRSRDRGDVGPHQLHNLHPRTRSSSGPISKRYKRQRLSPGLEPRKDAINSGVTDERRDGSEHLWQKIGRKYRSFLNMDPSGPSTDP